MRALAAVLLILSGAFVAGCSGSDDAKQPPTSSAGLPVIELRYDGGLLRVEVASTAEQRATGLGNRDVLADYAGMLFDLGESRLPSFWMKDTRIPLDMIWIRDDHSVAGAAENVQPEPGAADADLRRYSSDEPVRYVLELNAGAAQQLGIAAGDTLEFEWPAAD